jgi:Pentapeptide repeats (8 copies)
MSQPAATIQQRIRFEEVTPAHEYAAFIAVSIEQLVAHLGLPLYEGYDDLDEMQLTFLTLPSGETVTLGEYLNCPQPGTSIYVDAAMQNIPQIVFDSCLQLQVSREEAIWFNSDWQDEIDRLYVEHGDIEKRLELSQLKELSQQNQYEPIDCFNHALMIYTREYVPATYWAMLQHNLGLAYFNRNKGDRRENLERSIECFNKSLEIYTENEFPEKWKINQADLKESQRSLTLFIVESIKSNARNSIYLRGDNLSNANLIGAHLIGNDLSDADLSCADLSGAYLVDANLSNANLNNANLSNAYLIRTNLSGTNLSNANIKNTRFGYNIGISDPMKQELIDRGAIFEDFPGDRSDSKNLAPR